MSKIENNCTWHFGKEAEDQKAHSTPLDKILDRGLMLRFCARRYRIQWTHTLRL